MKFCTKCNKNKDDRDFYKKGNRLQAYCKLCFNNYCIERWKQRKVDAVNYKGGICEDCEGVFHACVYDFHHLHDKEYDWTKLRLRAWESIKLELDKCALLCSNCHRIRHYDQSTQST